MATLPLFPTDDGWPYPDSDDLDGFDESSEIDTIEHLDVAPGAHAFDALSTEELFVVQQRFGQTPQTMKSIAFDLGCSRTDARELLADALNKLRTELARD